MKCSRCGILFSAESAIVTDHKYVQSCIDALKARVKELDHPPIQPPIQPMAVVHGPNLCGHTHPTKPGGCETVIKSPPPTKCQIFGCGHGAPYVYKEVAVCFEHWNKLALNDTTVITPGTTIATSANPVQFNSTSGIIYFPGDTNAGAAIV